MICDFNTLETFLAVRSALKNLSKILVSQHHSIVCQTQIENIHKKLREFYIFVLDYRASDDYSLLCKYIDYSKCTNFFNRLNDDFLVALKNRNLTLKDILSLLKQISLTINEIDKVIIGINDIYFL